MKFHDCGRSWSVDCVSFHASGEEENVGFVAINMQQPLMDGTVY